MASKMKHAASHMGDTMALKSVKDVNKAGLDLFRDLADESDVKRNKTCIALVQHLVEMVGEEAEGNESKSLVYCLRRLVRGLGSTRQLVQKGYFTALVGVMEACPTRVTFDLFIDILEKELTCGKTAGKGEEGEAMMGQVFAYGAAIRGGLFARCSTDQQKNILSTLIGLSRMKSYLPYACSSFLHDLILTSEESVLVEVIWPGLKEEVSKPWQDQTLDSLLYLVSIHNRIPNVVKSKTIQKWLGCPLFSLESMQQFAQRLVGSSIPLALTHPVYDGFLCSLSSQDHESLLQNFWAVNVNNILEFTNRNRDQAALHCLVIIIKNLSNKKQIELLLTPRIVDLIRRTCGKNNPKEISSKALEVVTSLGNALTPQDVPDKIRLKVIHKIIFESGNLQFEKQTGTRLLVNLQSQLTKKGVQDLAKQYNGVIDNKSEAWTKPNRIFAAQQLTRLIGHQACINEMGWKVEQLLFLLHRGIFYQSSIGADLAYELKKCFFNALDEKFVNLETMLGVLSQVLTDVNDNLPKQKMIRSLSVEASVAWQKMWKRVSILKKENISTVNKQSAQQIFYLLFVFMGLQLLSDPELAISSLEELHSCYERFKGGKRVSNASGEPLWIEVTIDLFLSLLSHESHLLRRIVCKVFPLLSKHLTVTAFYQILAALDPSQDENPLTDKNIEEASGSESEESSDEHENGKLQEDEENSDDSSDDDENDEDEDNEEEWEDNEDSGDKETIIDKLRQELRMALGDGGTVTDTESVDLDDIDEEEGQRIDSALAQVFKSLRMKRKSKKNKKQLKVDRLATNFRNRVLDLVEIYISREPAMDICLECVAPLLSLVSFCVKDVHQKTLETRTRGILNKLTNVKKFSSFDGVSEELLAEQIKSLTDKGIGAATSSLGLAGLISECRTFLVRCSVIISSHSSKPYKSLGPVAKVYETLLLDFFTKRSTLLSSSMFTSVLNLQWNGCWHLASFVVQHAFDNNVHRFRRGQAIEMLSIFFRNNRLLHSAKEKQMKTLKNIVNSFVEQTIQLLNALQNDSLSKQKNHFTASVLRLVGQILSRPETRPADISTLSVALASFCQGCAGVTQEVVTALRPLSKKLKFNMSMLKKLKNPRKTGNQEDANISSSSDDEDEEEESKKKLTANNQMNGSVEDDTQAEVRQKQKNKSSKKSRKKEKKMQRLATLGEGLGAITFSAVNDDVLNGIEPEEESSFSGHSSSKLNGSVKSDGMPPIKRKSKNSVSDNSQGVKKKKKSNF